MNKNLVAFVVAFVAPVVIGNAVIGNAVIRHYAEAVHKQAVWTGIEKDILCLEAQAENHTATLIDRLKAE